MSNKIRVVMLGVCYFLMLVMSSLAIVSIIPPLDMISMNEGAPVIKRRNSDFIIAEITQIASSSNRIYVLYGTFGIVQAYDLDGTYLYSVSVCNHMNGRIEIAESNNQLYISDKKRNIYIFSDDKMEMYLDNNTPQAKTVYTDLKQKWSNSSSDYIVSGASIIQKSSGEQTKCIVHRPVWLLIFQNGRLFIYFFIIAVIYGYTLMLPKRQGTKKTQ